jgi:hypothetical protein
MNQTLQLVFSMGAMVVALVSIAVRFWRRPPRRTKDHSERVNLPTGPKMSAATSARSSTSVQNVASL